MQNIKKIPTEELVAELLGRNEAKVLKVLEKDQGVYIYGSKEQTEALPEGTIIAAIYSDQMH